MSPHVTVLPFCFVRTRNCFGDQEHFATSVKAPPLRVCSHLGDARATDMSWRRNEHNIGQLAREHFGRELTFNIGFTTHTGGWDQGLLGVCARGGYGSRSFGAWHAAGAA